MDAYVLLRTEPGQTRNTAGRAAGLAGNGIRQSFVVTGEWDVVVALEVDTPQQLGDVLMDQVLNDETIAESHTAIAVDTEAAFGIPRPPVPVRSRNAVTALVLATLDASSGREAPGGWAGWLGGLTEAVQGVPAVVASALVTGEYDLIVEVGGETWGEVSAGILGVAALPGIAATSTAVAVTEKLVSDSA